MSLGFNVKEYYVIITSPASKIKDPLRVPRTLKHMIWRFRACGFARPLLPQRKSCYNKTK